MKKDCAAAMMEGGASYLQIEKLVALVAPGGSLEICTTAGLRLGSWQQLLKGRGGGIYS